MEIEKVIAAGQLRRDPKWTESLAVGSETFVRTVGRHVRNRMMAETKPADFGNSAWILRESSDQPDSYYSYREKTDGKTSAKDQKSLVFNL